MMEDDQPKQEIEQEEKQKVIHGGRNLVLLGISSIVIALITTSISIFIYRYTGDIYLDRSRPGYIAEGEKRDDEDDSKEDFSNEGEVDKKALEEYLKELESIQGRINAHENNFDAEPLTDDALGIYDYTEEQEEFSED